MKTIHVIKFSLPVLVVGMVTIGLATAQSRRMQGLASGAWPKARGDAQNTGRGYGAGAVGVQKWVFATNGRISCSPVIGPAGIVYVGSEDNYLYALDIATGKLKWKFTTWGEVESTPAIGANGILYVGSAEGILYALDAKNGTKRWQYKVRGAATNRESLGEIPDSPLTFYTAPSRIIGAPTIGPDGTVYIAAGDGYLYALDGRNGAKKWEMKPGYIASYSMCPALNVKGDRLYFFSDDDGNAYNRIIAIDAHTGSVTWRVSIPNTDHIVSSPVIGPTGALYYCGYGSPKKDGPKTPAGFLFAVNPTTGKIVWRYNSGSMLWLPIVGADGALYASILGDDEAFSGLMAVDGATGKKHWEVLYGKQMMGPAILGSDNTIYASSSDGYFRAVDCKNGSVKWMFKTGDTAGIAPALAADGTVFVGSIDHKLYAIK